MEEEIVWEGNPSQWTNFRYYILCGLFFWLVIPIFMAWWRYLTTKNYTYKISNERIIERYGVFSKTEDDLELFRIKDVRQNEPFWLNMVGKCTIHFVTTDRTDSVVSLLGVPKDAKLKETIRGFIRKDPRQKELDIV
tara:strand:- start:1146 stop:1556 length:411 start_codon:yes stop_codon:yes gene_type:complete